jgi:O-antigen biosynthesis protein
VDGAFGAAAPKLTMPASSPTDPPCPAQLAGSTALVVLGMHRSGTSALAGMLHHLGVDFGHRLMPASPDNPRGYWEHRDLVAVNDRLLAELGCRWDMVRPMPSGWLDAAAARRASQLVESMLLRDFAGASLWGIKDPRLCRLLPLWTAVLDRLGVAARFVLALRHPDEVAASLAARDQLSAAPARLLWLRHVLEAEAAARGRPRVIVHYEDLVTAGGWRPVAACIARELGLVWPADAVTATAVEAYLAPELRHHRAGASAPPAANECAGDWVSAVHGAFSCSDPGAICDRVSGELDRADRAYGPLLGEAEAKLAGFAAEAETQRRLLAGLANRLQRDSGAAAAGVRAASAAAPAGIVMPQAVAAAEAYRYWLASRASTAAAQPQWVAERVAEWPFVPKIALAAVAPAGAEDRMLLTLRSLSRQVVGDWELHVAAPAAPPPAVAAEPRVHWQQIEGGAIDALNRRLARSEAHAVALIDAGDQLPPHALFSLVDALFRHPEWQAVYSDEDRIDLNGARSAPHFKPDFDLDLLRSLPYVGALLVVRREIFAELGGFDGARDGLEEYDFALRLAERLGAPGIGHIADVLYHRLPVSGRSTRPIAAICADMPTVVQAHLDRLGIAGTAEAGVQPHFCRVRFRHPDPPPLVSIIVPTKNQLALLKRCVEAVLHKTAYQNYELIVVDNGGTEADACSYLQLIEDKFDDIGSRIRVLRHPGAYNFAAINNRAVREAARGEYLCLLNNDVAPLDGDWLDEMMALARRPEVGAVGAKLTYPDGRIQHAGVILGVGWGAPADHPYIGEPGTAVGYWGRAQAVQGLSAVTAACLLTRRLVFEEVGGLDAETFTVSYNDVDYCLKLRAAGYRVLWTPFARLLHEGSASLGSDVEDKVAQEKAARFAREKMAMYRRWMPQIAFDPAYNRNLSSHGSGFAIETEAPPTWDPEFRPRPRILIHPADREGCGEYRIIAPSRALRHSGLVHCHETMRIYTPPEVARMQPDSVVMQRQLEWPQIEAIERLKETSRAFRIFELDDLVTNLPFKSVHRKAMPADIRERLKKALSLCDRLVVSTEPLAREYGRLCGETVVLPNRLERARWSNLALPSRREGKPRVGWAGAVGHLGDLSVIDSVVEATAKEIDWVFFGMCPDRLKPHAAEFYDCVPLDEYPQKLASLDLDLAVAPLELHAFNEAKSNLRLLEYGVLGYPVVCTDITPYQCGLPVTRVANRHSAWVKAVRNMVADRDACRQAGERLRMAILAGWMLEDHLADWRRAWLP